MSCADLTGARWSGYTAREIDEVYEMRAHLQAEAERRMPMPANRELTAQLLAIHDTYGQAIDSGDLPTVCALNSAFHRRIWASCGSAYLTHLLERIWSETLGIRCYGIADPHLLARARREHAEMIAMLETGDRDGFSHVSLNHIWPALEAFKLSQGAGTRPVTSDARRKESTMSPSYEILVQGNSLRLRDGFLGISTIGLIHAGSGTDPVRHGRLCYPSRSPAGLGRPRSQTG